jgi:hypothetical protein
LAINPETVFGLSGEIMERAFWLAVGVALVLMAGCADAEGLEVADVNARNAISKADAALARLDELEGRVGDLESKLGHVAISDTYSIGWHDTHTDLGVFAT